MNIHEYQSKEILQKYGIPIPKYGVASNPSEIKKVLRTLKLTKGVVKIQVHAGGRGKAGGVKIGKSKEELLDIGEDLLNMKLVNEQTGPDGVVAKNVLISELVQIKKEYYLGAVIDRKMAQAVLIASPQGGVEIEEVAAKDPHKILKIPIQLDGTLRSYHLVALTKFMGWEQEIGEEGKKIARALARLFMEQDCSLVEINPLVESGKNKLWALDAKISIDDNALYRQKEMARFYDPTQQSKNEVKAKKFDLAYIALSGNIGCMVNGAGLAMATMDLIKTCGGLPANFLDVGGSATEERISEGFKILLADRRVKAILVNIFGGIMNCVTIAQGLLSVAKTNKIQIPIVVRMEGTEVDQGKRLLQTAPFKVMFAESLAEAAEKIVKVI